MMKIGMNLLLWTDRPDPDRHGELLEKIKQWGFDGVELAADALDAASAKGFSTRLRDLGLGCTSIAALDAQAADPASREMRLRMAALDELKRAIDNTKVLGGDLLCGPLFQGLGRFSGRGPEADEQAHAVETLRAAGEYARSVGVRLALEPINRFEMYLVNTLSEARRLVEAIDLPNVGLLADTHHGNIEEADVPQAWREAARHILHVHISENHRGVPGSGHAVPAAVFETLRTIGYDGWLTIEAFNPQVAGLVSRLHLWREYAEHQDDAARLGIAYIRSQLEGIQ